MSRRRLHLTAAALLLVSASAACGAAGVDPNDVVRTDSAAVEIVTSTGSDRPLDWTFEPLARMGDADGPDALGGTFPNGIASDGERIYVLDAMANTVIVYAPDGTELRRLGRGGGGPGEFEFPYALVIEPEGVVGVAAMRKRALVRFDTLGAPLEERRIEAYPGDPVNVLADGLVYVTPLARDQGGTSAPVRALVVARGAAVDTIAELVVDRPRFFQLPDCPISLSVPPLLAPELIWTATPSRVYWSAGPEAAVHVWETGSATRIIRRTLAPIETTAQLAATEMQDTFRITAGSNDCRIPAEKVVEARGYAPVAQHIVGVAVAPDGHLWVRRRTADGAKPIDVFDVDGTYVGTLPPEVPWPAAFLDDGTYVALERDELDLQSVVRYRVVAGGSVP